jgi:hypothetical protein
MIAAPVGHCRLRRNLPGEIMHLFIDKEALRVALDCDPSGGQHGHGFGFGAALRGAAVAMDAR